MTARAYRAIVVVVLLLAGAGLAVHQVHQVVACYPGGGRIDAPVWGTTRNLAEREIRNVCGPDRDGARWNQLAGWLWFAAFGVAALTAPSSLACLRARHR